MDTRAPSASRSATHAHAQSHDHDHDHDHGHAHAPATPAAHGDCCGHACETAEPVLPPAAPTALTGYTRYRIASMDCAVEQAEIRAALEPIAGIEALRFDLPQRQLALKAPEAVQDQAVAAIRRLGYEPQLLSQDAEPGAAAAEGLGAGISRLIASLLAALGAEALAFFAPDTLPWQIASMALALTAIGLAGLETYKKGLAALRVGRLNINALMAVAVTGAFVIGQWPEAAMVMALYALAELIEARAVDRARHAIQSLLALAPEDAEVLQADGQWRRLPSAEVGLGATVRLKPGERVPLDGRVLRGQSAVDQAPVTGESLPVDKRAGDALFAGTINQTAALEFEVTALAADSTLARIIHAVEEAQSSRAPTQRFVDRFAAIYTPAVFVLALAVALLMPWLAGWTWMQSVYKALVLLVIACPCALVISTPVTVVSGLAAAARRGILIKGGVYLEEARKLKVVALDKTGTLTEGRPVLTHFELLRPSAELARVQAWAQALAARSDHPVSKAIAQGLAVAAAPEVQGFRAEAGRGVAGQVEGQALVLANHRWIEERGQCSRDLEAQMALHEQAGRSVSLLADAGGVLVLCAVADTVKPSSRQAVADLIDLGLTPVMLSGDNPRTAQAIAAQLGITELRANLLPEDKLAAITELQARLGLTAMVGDGINDAPALARADIGFAMGGAGTHTAMEAADVVVMNDDLSRLPETIRLSRRARVVLWQNIALALGIKAAFLLAALFGSATMWMAVFADMGASLLVVFNGLRMLRGARR
ncbi:heavy metal translocating P-type ATPase [Kinneretia aquatilis]|uniref:heavy metal translocating P-type ATPase n=1 Tax=Kinneretia aquatilis TaxID=2070761 RepID=UPI0014951DB4|nr:heavy metal translocating P-type ATPase [Paucibacter aquatile]WIV96837.1 heavy metal translocating P-type ATPase [Paucibacter aquatile]